MFDVVLAKEGHEQRIVADIRSLDARIITSFEPHRVRVEIPEKGFDRGIEGNRATIPDVDLMKAVVTRVVVPLADELGVQRVEMGTLQSCAAAGEVRPPDSRGACRTTCSVPPCSGRFSAPCHVAPELERLGGAP
ncbi:MAG: hypothetical protein M3619_33025 [Myxococcota bacterium]|nr:hypothetical protein [Myxococcota bacterium]